MSLQFSNPTGLGQIQLCEDNCGFDRGDILNSPTLLQRFTGYLNLGLDDAWSLIIQATGKWHMDDINYPDYPMIETDIVSGQRDYPVVTDESGNIVLEVYRVMVADPSGTYHEIHPVDQFQTTYGTGNLENTDSMINSQHASGTPTRYSKTGNGFFLDVIPNYYLAKGLRVFVDREASYFIPSASVDASAKLPGFVGIFHQYIATFASELYSGIKTLTNSKKLTTDKMNMRRDLQLYYTQRDKDTPKRMIPNVENNK